MIAHQKILTFRHLIRQIDVAVAQRLVRQIRLVNHRSVHRNIAVRIDVNAVARRPNHALNQRLVGIQKRTQIAAFQLVRFHQHHNLAFVQRRRHAGSGNLHHRQHQRRNQHRHRRHNHQRIHRAAQHPAVQHLIFFLPNRLPHRVCGRQRRFRRASVIHLSSPQSRQTNRPESAFVCKFFAAVP